MQDTEKGSKEIGTQAARGSGRVEAFWQTVVEAGLLSSSHERKYLGLQLFRRMLPILRQAPAFSDGSGVKEGISFKVQGSLCYSQACKRFDYVMMTDKSDCSVTAPTTTPQSKLCKLILRLLFFVVPGLHETSRPAIQVEAQPVCLGFGC